MQRQPFPACGAAEACTPTLPYPEKSTNARAREVVVQWTTRDVGAPVAMVGTTPGGPYPITANGATSTYLRSDMCGGIAATYGYFNPGTFNAATVRGLAPSTTYYYTYGAAAACPLALTFAHLRVRSRANGGCAGCTA